MRSIHVSLKGGLGNRLFIISGARALKDLGFETKLARNSAQELSFFELDLIESVGLEVVEIDPWVNAMRWIDSPSSPLSSLGLGQWHHEQNIGYFDLAGLASKRLRGVDAYFQAKSWALPPSLLQSVFLKNLPDPRVAVEASGKTTAIHIRRGDYLRFKTIYGFIDARTYLEIAKEKGVDWGTTVVFSDDEDAVRDEFHSLGQKVFVCSDLFGDRDAVESLALMSSFGRIITSNSTLSWWAGWLGEGHVIYPSPWINGPLNELFLVPDSWEKFTHPSLASSPNLGPCEE